MSLGYWNQVQATGFEVPTDRPLDDLTAELTTMLGSTEAEVRDGTAYPALATWIDGGVYDDLLAGLGDGMTVGLSAGVGENGTDSVFRRSFSALILAECLERDNAQHLLPSARRSWTGATGSRPGSSPRRTPAASCRARAGPTRSPTAPTPSASSASRPTWPAPSTRCCSTSWPSACSSSRSTSRSWRASPTGWPHAAMRILRRNTVGVDVLEPWIHRIGGAANPFGKGGASDPYPAAAAPQAFLRALLRAALARPEAPTVRPDLLLVVIEALRMSNSAYLRVGTG